MMLASRLNSIQPYYKLDELSVGAASLGGSSVLKSTSPKSKKTTKSPKSKKGRPAGGAGEDNSTIKTNEKSIYDFSFSDDEEDNLSLNSTHLFPSTNKKKLKSNSNNNSIDNNDDSYFFSHFPVVNILFEDMKIQNGQEIIDLAVIKEPYHDCYILFGKNLENDQRHEIRFTSEEISNILDSDILLTTLDSNKKAWSLLVNKIDIPAVEEFSLISIDSFDLERSNQKSHEDNKSMNHQLSTHSLEQISNQLTERYATTTTTVISEESHSLEKKPVLQSQTQPNAAKISSTSSPRQLEQKYPNAPKPYLRPSFVITSPTTENNMSNKTHHRGRIIKESPTKQPTQQNPSPPSQPQQKESLALQQPQQPETSAGSSSRSKSFRKTMIKKKRLDLESAYQVNLQTFSNDSGDGMTTSSPRDEDSPVKPMVPAAANAAAAFTRLQEEKNRLEVEITLLSMINEITEYYYLTTENKKIFEQQQQQHHKQQLQNERNTKEQQQQKKQEIPQEKKDPNDKNTRNHTLSVILEGMEKKLAQNHSKLQGMTTQREALKKEILVWTQKFQAKHHSLPAAEDKIVMQEKYQNYKIINCQIKELNVLQSKLFHNKQKALHEMQMTEIHLISQKFVSSLLFPPVSSLPPTKHQP
jgi:hypothetical protein